MSMSYWCLCRGRHPNCPGWAAYLADHGEHSADVQIDHIYPLHRAYQYGAWKWSDAKRLRFANDPANLRAVDGSANASKGDSGPDDWKPRTEHHCAYATAYVKVASRYKLAITKPDRAALTRMLATCSKGASNQ